MLVFLRSAFRHIFYPEIDAYFFAFTRGKLKFSRGARDAYGVVVRENGVGGDRYQLVVDVDMEVFRVNAAARAVALDSYLIYNSAAILIKG